MTADMHVFMVVGVLGKGGMTAAIMNRSRMLADAGVPATIVTLEHDLKHDERNEEYRTMGWLDPRVEVVNVYELAAAAVDADPDTGRRRPLLEGLRARVAVRTRVRAAANRVQDALGRRGGTGESRRARTAVLPPMRDRTPDPAGPPGARVVHDIVGQSVREVTYDRDGRPRYERILHPGTDVLAQERFYSPSGRLYFVRHYDAAGRPVGAESVSASGKRTRTWGQTAWQARWLTRMAQQVDGSPVVICDGPGSATKVLRIPRTSAATLFMVHNNHFKQKPWRPGAPVRDDYGKLFRRTGDMDALVVLTDEQANDIGDEFGCHDAIRVVPNSVPTDPVDVEPEEREPLTVSMFARMVNQKNLFEAVDLWADVVARVPGARLDIYGTGRLEERLRAHVVKRHLRDSVAVRGYTREAPRVMARSTAVLCTSHYEGLPVGFLEAYRSGTPMVSYACRYGPKDLIEDGVTGFLVPQGDRAALVDRIVQLLQDPDQARRMGAAGRERILSRYANDVVATRWFDVLREAADALETRRAAEAG